MSKYLKSGPSRHLKIRQRSAAFSKIEPLPIPGTPARNAMGYTDNDERLFDELNQRNQGNARTRHVRNKRRSNYKTLYTPQDIKLFDSILAGSKHSSIESHDNGLPSTGIRIMEFNDQPNTTNSSTPASSETSMSVRYFD